MYEYLVMVCNYAVGNEVRCGCLGDTSSPIDQLRLSGRIEKERLNSPPLKVSKCSKCTKSTNWPKQDMLPFLQVLYSDGSSMMNKVSSWMDVTYPRSQFDKCLAGPNGRFAMNH